MTDSQSQDVAGLFTRLYEKPCRQLTELESGSPNKSYRIVSDTEYVFKESVFRASNDWWEFQESALEDLCKEGFPVQSPLKNVLGKYSFADSNHNRWQLRTYAHGREFESTNPKDAMKAMDFLNRLHSVRGFSASPPSANQDLEEWLADGGALLSGAIEYLKGSPCCVYVARLQDAWTKHAALAAEQLDLKRYQTLPMALTHGEFHGNNLLFDGDDLCCVLDWDAVQVRPAIYDIARSSFFMSRLKRGAFKLDQQKAAEFVGGYHRKIAEEELDVVVPILLFYFLPTARYLKLMHESSVAMLEWYLQWSYDGLTNVLYEMTPVIKALKEKAA